MIRVQNLTKKYIGFKSPYERIFTALTFGIIPGSRSYTALNEINLEVNSGEIIGIIGRNGAGKSTLIKVLSGVSKYQSGSFERKGSLRSILELGVGFNPELSGEENVYYNGLVWGYSVEEIDNLVVNALQFHESLLDRGINFVVPESQSEVAQIRRPLKQAPNATNAKALCLHDILWGLMRNFEWGYSHQKLKGQARQAVDVAA